MDYMIARHLASGSQVTIPDAIKGILVRIIVFVDPVAITDGAYYNMRLYETAANANNHLLSCGQYCEITTDGGLSVPLHSQLDCNLMLHKNMTYIVVVAASVFADVSVIFDILPFEKTMKGINAGLRER